MSLKTHQNKVAPKKSVPANHNSITDPSTYKNCIPKSTLSDIISLVKLSYSDIQDSSKISSKIPHTLISHGVIGLDNQQFFDELSKPSIPSSYAENSDSLPLNRPYFHLPHSSFPLSTHSLAILLYKFNIEHVLIKTLLHKYRSEFRRQGYFIKLTHISRILKHIQNHFQHIYLTSCDIVQIINDCTQKTQFKVPSVQQQRQENSTFFTGEVISPSILNAVQEYFTTNKSHIVLFFYHIIAAQDYIVHFYRVCLPTLTDINAHISKTYFLSFCVTSCAILTRLLYIVKQFFFLIFPFMTIMTIPTHYLTFSTQYMTTLLSEYDNNLSLPTIKSYLAFISPSHLSSKSTETASIQSHPHLYHHHQYQHQANHHYITISLWYQILKYDWIFWIFHHTLHYSSNEQGKYLYSTPLVYQNHAILPSSQTLSHYPPICHRYIKSSPDISYSNEISQIDQKSTISNKSNKKLIKTTDTRPKSYWADIITLFSQKNKSLLHRNPFLALSIVKPTFVKKLSLNACKTKSYSVSNIPPLSSISSLSQQFSACSDVFTWLHILINSWHHLQHHSLTSSTTTASSPMPLTLSSILPSTVISVLSFFIKQVSYYPDKNMYNVLLQKSTDIYDPALLSSVSSSFAQHFCFWSIEQLSKNNHIQSNILFAFSPIIQELVQFKGKEFDKSNIDCLSLLPLGIVQSPHVTSETNFDNIYDKYNKNNNSFSLLLHSSSTTITEQDCYELNDYVSSISSLNLLNQLDPYVTIFNNTKQKQEKSHTTTLSGFSVDQTTDNQNNVSNQTIKPKNTSLLTAAVSTASDIDDTNENKKESDDELDSSSLQSLNNLSTSSNIRKTAPTTVDHNKVLKRKKTVTNNLIKPSISKLMLTKSKKNSK